MCWTARSDGSIELHFVRPDLSGIFVSEVAQAGNELFNTDILMRAIHFAEGLFVTGIEARGRESIVSVEPSLCNQ